MYEREIGVESGFVADNTERLQDFVADANLALDSFLTIAFRADGTWQFDDSNHADYPIITTDIVDGQRDYPFTSDETGNLILELQAVFIGTDSDGPLYQEIHPVDVPSDETHETQGLWDNENTEGTPYRYGKLANGIFLDPIPSYNKTNGLKMYISREGSYFTTSDTTKKPGVPGVFHHYFYLKPALDYARRNRLANESNIRAEVLQLEVDIEEHFAMREGDKRHIMSNIPITYK